MLPATGLPSPSISEKLPDCVDKAWPVPASGPVLLAEAPRLTPAVASWVDGSVKFTVLPVAEALLVWARRFRPWAQSPAE